MTLVYFNDDLLDLYPNTVVAQTLKANELGQLNTIYRNYTNQFRLPFTENNDRIFENARLLQSQGDAVYTSNTCKVVVNGVEVIANGMPIVKKASDSYEMFVISGVTFFDVLGNKKLKDLDFHSYNGSWGGVYTASYRTATSGIVAPVMDYGNFNTGTPSIGIDSYLPSCYYHTIVSEIISQAGYSKSGSIFSDAKYLATIVAFSKSQMKYSQDFVDARTTIATTGSQALSGGKINFPTLFSQGSEGYYDTSTSRYTPNDPSGGTELFRLQVIIELDITVTGGTIDVEIYNKSQTLLTNIGTGVYTAQLPEPNDFVLATNANFIEIRYNTNTGTPSATVNSGRITFVPKAEPPAASTNNYIYFNELLPDMTQKDFLKDFAFRYNQVFKEEDGVLYCKSIDAIIADKASATDWTDKRAKIQGEDISFTPQGFAKNNYLRYNNADTLIPADFGQANITITNQGIPDEKTLTNIFSASLTTEKAGISMAVLDVYTDSTSFFDLDNDPGKRILLVRSKRSTEPSVTYSLSQSSYLVAYFDDPNETYSLKFEDTLSDDYPLFSEALQKAKIVIRYYNLTEADIANMDFFVPVFDTDSYYLKNTVGPYVAGELTKVELLKI